MREYASLYGITKTILLSSFCKVNATSSSYNFFVMIWLPLTNLIDFFALILRTLFTVSLIQGPAALINIFPKGIAVPTALFDYSINDFTVIFTNISDQINLHTKSRRFWMNIFHFVNINCYQFRFKLIRYIKRSCNVFTKLKTSNFYPKKYFFQW